MVLRMIALSAAFLFTASSFAGSLPDIKMADTGLAFQKIEGQ